ncbi:MAG: trypsin-like peptidase domain-containing protein [Clostridia bacterium]|nr:trypsin-like peptidase domain-containing protein [Clostridia bacterium]
MRRNWLGIIAVALACAMLGGALTLAWMGSGGAPLPLTPRARAEGTLLPTLEGFDSPFVQVAETVMPCVVSVSNKGRAFNLLSGRPEQVEQASGSGVVISVHGHIVTNYHVIADARAVTVIAGGVEYDAHVVGYDALTDLAVLQVLDANLPAAVMGDSDAERVGNWGIVIGNPLGQMFVDTVTVGILSAVNREVEGSLVKMIQTDAAINSGNSGGGLFNTKGELIGIPSMKFVSTSPHNSIEGIGMAIPINVAKPIVASIIEHGRVLRPRMGVEIATLPGTEKVEADSLPAGALISGVSPGSPAEKAGIQPGDIVMSINGSRVRNFTDLIDRVNTRVPGDKVTLEVYRVPGILDLTHRDAIPDGEMLTIEVVLGSAE